MHMKSVVIGFKILMMMTNTDLTDIQIQIPTI